MPSNQENSKEYSLVGFDKNMQIEGLNSFAKNLEKNFFSQVIVRNISTISTQINLVIELTCNLDLNETLTHFKKEIWGNFASKEHSFVMDFQQLKDLNDIAIEVEELSIFLKDTSIIITSIYSQSIPEQLEGILSELERSSLHFMKRQTEVPFEIYLPVYEENDTAYENETVIEVESNSNSAQNYFSYWGMYFHTENDAMVYDLKNQILINGTVQMLNR